MNRREIFVDTGVWLALGDRSDAQHTPAVAGYERLLEQAVSLVTTNLVVAESYEAIRRAAGYAFAMRFLQTLRKSSRLSLVYSTRAVEERAEAVLQRYHDQRFSYVDAVSFAVMTERRIGEAFAFDHHFETAGFTLVPLES